MAMAGRKIIDYADLCSERTERLGEMPSDEARAARHKDAAASKGVAIRLRSEFVGHVDQRGGQLYRGGRVDIGDSVAAPDTIPALCLI